jgi:hypothetical protein
VRAVEALATTLPLFLLLFAWAYLTMANDNPANFNTHPLTRRPPAEGPGSVVLAG